MPIETPEILNVSEEVKTLLSERSVLKAEFHNGEAAIATARKKIEELDAKLIGAGYLASDLIARW